MTTWQPRIDVIDVYTADPDATSHFYQRVFGLPATRQPDCTQFNFGDKTLHVRDAATAAGFIAPAVTAAPGEGARGAFTMFTDDIDAACAAVTEAGAVLVNGPADRWWGIRNALFADPVGLLWELAGPVREPGAAPDPAAETWAAQEKGIGNIMLFAADVRALQAFYADRFGLPLHQEMHDGASFDLANASLGLLDLAGARDLIGPAAVAEPDAGLRFTFCVFADNLGAVRADLASRGAEPFRPATEFAGGESVHRLESFRDPAGNIWEIVEAAAAGPVPG